MYSDTGNMQIYPCEYWLLCVMVIGTGHPFQEIEQNTESGSLLVGWLDYS